MYLFIYSFMGIVPLVLCISTILLTTSAKKMAGKKRVARIMQSGEPGS